MTTVEFVKLERPEKARILCDLAQEFYAQGHRVAVMVQDGNQGVSLDQFMWVWKKDTFLPHVYDNGSVEGYDEPVVIITEENIPNGSQVLIMGEPCSVDFMRQFRHVVDFAEIHDPDLREASRERFKIYREAGFAPVMR